MTSTATDDTAARARARHPARSVIIAVLTSLAVVAQAHAAEIPLDTFYPTSFAREPEPVRQTVVTVHKSRTVHIAQPFAKAIVADGTIADALPMTNQMLYIQGKKVGTTNVSLFDENAKLVAVVDLEVAIDAANVQQKIQASIGNRAIRVAADGTQVILTGLAPDTIAADRALAVARGIVGEDKVVNAMQVAPPQQVMLEVRFLEVSRTAGRQLGVNWFGAGPNGRGFNTGLPGNAAPTSFIPPGSSPSANTCVSNPTSTTCTTPPGITPVPVFATAGTLLGTTGGPFATVLANVLKSGNTSLDVMVTALEEKGLIRRLAEPNLIALSGDTARFLAGGEFPFPQVQPGSSGTVPVITTEFKKFGVQLAFVPTVLSRGVINLRVEPSVSELDFINSVTIAGVQIPSIITRDARTTVELRDGQSFAIAGLLQNRNARDLNQVPWLGTVPILGALFRSSAYLQQETDLVVIITPRLVAPAAPGQQLASPLDSRLPSNDVDFFLNGQPEVRKRYTDFVSTGGDLKGPYGHMIVPEMGINGVAVKGNDVIVRARN
jgi:pilus assembly protein CpaC